MASIVLLLLASTATALPAEPVATPDCPASLTRASEQQIRDFLDAGREDYKLAANDVGPTMRARAERFVTERYLQHHPGVEDGREPFAQFHIKWYHDHPPQPGHGALAGMVAHCDLVAIMHRRPMSDPQHPGATYDSFGFDMWRLVGGRADEHWDSYLEYFRADATRDESPEGKEVKRKTPPPAQDARADLNCDATQPARNRQLVLALGKVGAAHAALTTFAEQSVASSYVEHNPLLAESSYQGRRGFVRSIESAAVNLPGVTQRYGTPEFIVADCSHVTTAKIIKRRESTAPHAVYEWFMFDSWRVQDNRLAEHWDATVKGVDYRWAEVDALNPHRQ